jgi:hypothetical protein
MAKKMRDKEKTKQHLINELVELRERVSELEKSEAKRFYHHA